MDRSAHADVHSAITARAQTAGMNKQHPGLVLAVTLVAASGAHAAITNGDFENGLSGWKTLGDASIYGPAPQGSGELWLTTASKNYADDAPLAAGALNRSGISAVAVGVANAGPTELTTLFQGGQMDDPTHGLYAFEGSAAGQIFTANAGDKLNFSWNFGTRDTYADFGFVVIDGTLIRLANSAAATQAGSNGNTYQTGFSDYAYTLLRGGPHLVIFGVTDVGDFNLTSTLAVDNVRITASVPEPRAWWLAGVALMMAGFVRRKS